MLRKRLIRTTIKFPQEEKVFLSKYGRFGNLVTMRQDFEVKAFVNVNSSGLHTAQIKLYNLNDTTSKKIEKAGQLVLLEAGWEGSIGKMFEGKISSVGRTKPTVSNPDIVTTLFCVSGIDILQKGIFGETVVFEDLVEDLPEGAAIFTDADLSTENVRFWITDVAAAILEEEGFEWRKYYIRHIGKCRY